MQEREYVNRIALLRPSVETKIVEAYRIAQRASNFTKPFVIDQKEFDMVGDLLILGEKYGWTNEPTLKEKKYEEIVIPTLKEILDCEEDNHPMSFADLYRLTRRDQELNIVALFEQRDKGNVKMNVCGLREDQRTFYVNPLFQSLVTREKNKHPIFDDPSITSVYV